MYMYPLVLLIATATIMLTFLGTHPLNAAEINETNLNTLFNSADYCLANADIIRFSIDRYNCCNIMEQTWQFITTLDFMQFSPDLQQHAYALHNEISPLTVGPLGVGQLGPIVDGVAQGCIPDCDVITDPTCTRLP